MARRLKNIETASSVEGQAFIDALALTAWPYIFDEELEDLKGLKALMSKAEPAVEQLKLGKALWTRIANNLTPDFEDATDHLVAFAEKVVEKKTEIQKNVSFSSAEVNFIKDWQLYMRTDSEPAMNRLRATVGRVASSDVIRYFAEEDAADAKAQKSDGAKVAMIVQQLSGRLATKMTISEAQAARENKPDLYKEYLAIRNRINKVTKQAIISITRAAGKPLLVSDVIKQLERRGIEHNLPASFAGKVDERGYYTLFDELIDGAPTGEVKMNPNYKRGSTNYVFQTRAEGAKTWQTIYTKSARQAKRETKFEGVANAFSDLESYKKKWRAYLTSRDYDKQQLGAICEILFLTASRIGTPGNETDGQKTYGMTTILGKHVTVKANSVRIKYPGKKGSQVDFLITGTDKYSKTLVKLVGEWATSAGKEQRVFKKTARDVNAFLKSVLKLPIKSHGFRHMRGTQIMAEELERLKQKLGKNPTDKSVMAVFNAAAERVGEVLGHTAVKPDGTTKIVGTTAIKNYINPGVMREFFATYNVRPPAVIEKMGE